MPKKPTPPRFLGKPMRAVSDGIRGDHWKLKVGRIECIVHPDKWFQRGDTTVPSWEGWAFWPGGGEAFFAPCETAQETATDLTKHIRAQARFWKRWKPPV